MAPVDNILNDEESGNVKNNAFAIKRNAKRLLNLVNQLLDFRQIEERESTLNLKKEEFVSFLGELVNSFRDLSDNRKVRIITLLDSSFIFLNTFWALLYTRRPSSVPNHILFVLSSIRDFMLKFGLSNFSFAFFLINVNVS